MAWIVEYLNDGVVREASVLPVDQRARLQRTIESIERHGIDQMHGPQFQHLQGNLWEIRISARSGISRAIYVTASGPRVVIVRVFVKKTRKTPRREVKLALERAREVE